MSLLLDALKKTGAAHQTELNDRTGAGNQTYPGNLSGMSLEELPINRGAASPPGNPSNPAVARGENPSSRSTGENLFAAKKAPPRKKFNYTLGIIPTALIIGGILGIAGGVYVWIEIQPPKAAQRGNTLPAAAYTAPAPVARTIPPLALLPEDLPEEKIQTRVSTPTTAPENTPRTGNMRRAPATQSAGGIQIQRKLANDSIYNKLTDAYHAYQSGDFGTAWQRYREVLQMDARNRDALLGMAAIAQQQEQDEAAIQYYKQVLILDPRDPVAQAGMSAFSTGDAADKESRLKQSLAQSPQSGALFFALGNLYTEQSRWGDAQQAYFNAFRLEPGSALFAFNLATSLDHLGQTKLAAQYYGQALRLDTAGNSGFDREQTEQRMKKLLAP